MAWSRSFGFALVMTVILVANVAAEAAPYVRPPARKAISFRAGVKRNSEVQQVRFNLPGIKGLRSLKYLFLLLITNSIFLCMKL